MENESLHRQLQEHRRLVEQSQTQQTQLEINVANLTSQVERLNLQMADMRKSNHALENELTQEQVANMNGKLQLAESLEKNDESERTIAQLKSEVSKLKHSLEEQQLHEATLLSTLAPPSIPTPTESTFLKKPPHTRNPSVTSTASGMSTFTLGSSFWSESTATSTQSAANRNTTTNKTVELLKNELDMMRQHTELISREYTMRHAAMDAELAQAKETADELKRENEMFQTHLAERVILEVDDFDETYANEQDEDPNMVQGRPVVRALVERLVARLLEFEPFAKQVQVDSRSLANFQHRMAHATYHHNFASPEQQQQVQRRLKMVADPGVWAHLLFAGAATAGTGSRPVSGDQQTQTPLSPTTSSSNSAASSVSTPATSIATTTNNNSNSPAAGAPVGPAAGIKRPHLQTQTKLQPLTIGSSPFT